MAKGFDDVVISDDGDRVFRDKRLGPWSAVCCPDVLVGGKDPDRDSIRECAIEDCR